VNRSHNSLQAGKRLFRCAHSFALDPSRAIRQYHKKCDTNWMPGRSASGHRGAASPALPAGAFAPAINAGSAVSAAPDRRRSVSAPLLTRAPLGEEQQMSDKHNNYLLDLGFLPKERALEAKQSSLVVKGTDDEAFQTGPLMAYYEVISLMQDQAEVLQIPLTEIRLDGIDPDKDLI
jgi:hypothetical protein